MPVTVTALDVYGNTATSFNGMVMLASTDQHATFSPGKDLVGGFGVFGAILRTAGAQTITATSFDEASLTGTSTTVLVAPSTATRLVVSTTAPPTDAKAGSGFQVTVTVLDAMGNTVTSQRADHDYEQRRPGHAAHRRDPVEWRRNLRRHPQNGGCRRP